MIVGDSTSRAMATVVAYLQAKDALEPIEPVVRSGDGGPYHRPSRLPVYASLAGRNQPCPCGSVRKYKKCHLGKPMPIEGSCEP